jgi:hypothetical protein
MPLERLFEAELEYRPAMDPIAADGEGELVGSGDGSVQGPIVHGALRWTLFEGPGDLVCTMNPTLVIDTQDGARIGIEGRGYARRATRTDQCWRVAGSFLFNAVGDSNTWLDGALGVWEGEFDAERHSATYRTFVQLPTEAEER